MNSNRRRNNNSIMTMMLLYQLFVTANESGIPPVTLFSIGGQVLLFLGIITVPWNDPSEICLSYTKIWHWRDYKRLLFGAFVHADSYHLYYNMISFMWKGKTLEILYGSGYFAFMLIVFTALTNIAYIFMNYALGILLMDESFFYSCAVGFSGTLFALKVVTTSLLDSNYGFANKWGVWLELGYISLITPNASFVGHLAGILVGFAYVQGPLKPFMRSIWSVVMAIWESFNPPNQRNQEEYYDESERFRREQQRRYANQGYNNYENQFRRRPGFSFGGF